MTVPERRGRKRRWPGHPLGPHFPSGRWTPPRGSVRTRWAGCCPPLSPAQLPTAGPRSPDPCRFPVLWPELGDLLAGRQLAHFRRQPPGPPGPLARQPGMTSVPILARGFAAQECGRGLREAAAQGSDVRPHFFFPKSQLAHRPLGLTVTCRARQPSRPVPSPLGEGGAAAQMHVCARECMCAVCRGSASLGKAGTVGKLSLG